MPKDNIERAIDKSSIAADSILKIRYEGFGPAKTAIVVVTFQIIKIELHQI